MALPPPPLLSSSLIIFSCQLCLLGLPPAQDVRQAAAYLTQPSPGGAPALGGGAWMMGARETKETAPTPILGAREAPFLPPVSQPLL